MAIENTKSGRVRSVHVSDDSIEKATLVIGSHLIQINGLTDELYETALQSAGEFGQYQVYYKSELADGSWFEVTEASSILEITSQGNPVNKTVIESLEFTHKTNADGITTDLRTGDKVGVFDINDPYQLETMQELEPLRIQRQLLEEKASPTEDDEIYKKLLTQFFQKPVQNDKTGQCDGQLKSLQAYIEGLAQRDKPGAWAEAANTVAQGIDAERRVESLTILDGWLDVLLEDASDLTAQPREKEDKEQEDTAAAFAVNPDVVAAVGEAKQNVEDSILTYTAKRLSQGSNVAGRSRYRYSRALIEKSQNGDTAGCDAAVENLCSLEHIISGRVADQDRELDLLHSDLISSSGAVYKEKLSLGAGGAYRQAVSDGVAAAALTRHLQTRKTETDAARTEYQTMLAAAFVRMENKEAQAYTLQLIDGVADLEAFIPDDAAAPYMRETTAAHLAWLQSELAELVRNDAGSSQMDTLKKEKEELSRKRREALDRNDLAQEKRLAAEEAAKQRDIDRLTEELTIVLGSQNSSQAEKARAMAALGEGSAASVMNALADKIALSVTEGGYETGETANSVNALAAVGALDPDAAQAALGRVRESLQSAVSLDAAAAKELSDRIDAAKAQISAAGRSGILTRDELTALLEQILGESPEKSSDTDQVAVVAALQRLGAETGNPEFGKLAAYYAGKLAEEGNPYVYRKYTAAAEVYVPLPVVGTAAGYRYIFEAGEARATLKKNSSYYTFTVAKRSYEMTGEASGELCGLLQQMGAPYLQAADTRELFGVDGLYIEDSAYGIALNGEIAKRMEEICELLAEGGG